MKIGNTLRELRETKKLTLEQLANHLNERIPKGVDITFNKGKLSKWERDMEVPTLYALKYVADFFEVTIDEMIENSNVVENVAPEPEIPEVIAAHFDGEMTDDDIEEINKFIEFVKSKK